MLSGLPDPVLQHHAQLPLSHCSPPSALPSNISISTLLFLTRVLYFAKTLQNNLANMEPADSDNLHQTTESLCHAGADQGTLNMSKCFRGMKCKIIYNVGLPTGTAKAWRAAVWLNSSLASSFLHQCAPNRATSDSDTIIPSSCVVAAVMWETKSFIEQAQQALWTSSRTKPPVHFTCGSHAVKL